MLKVEEKGSVDTGGRSTVDNVDFFRIGEGRGEDYGKEEERI